MQNADSALDFSMDSLHLAWVNTVMLVPRRVGHDQPLSFAQSQVRKKINASPIYFVEYKKIASQVGPCFRPSMSGNVLGQAHGRQRGTSDRILTHAIRVFILEEKINPSEYSRLCDLAKQLGAVVCTDRRDANMLLTGIRAPKRIEMHTSAEERDFMPILKAEWLDECARENKSLAFEGFLAWQPRRVREQGPTAQCCVCDSDATPTPSSPSSIPSREASPAPTWTNSEYAVCRATPLRSTWNQTLVEELELLRTHRSLAHDVHSELAYLRAASAVKAVPHSLATTSHADLRQIKGIGPKMATTIRQFYEEGYIPEARIIRSDPAVQTMLSFMKLYGIGPRTAERAYNEGCRTLEDVTRRCKTDLSARLGPATSLALLPDLSQLIPRDQVESIAAAILHTLQSMVPDAQATIAGSFRRGKAASGDVDMVISGTTSNSASSILCSLVQALQRLGRVTHILSVPRQEDHREVDVAEVVYVAPTALHGSVHRRVDIVFAAPKRYGAAILAWTGSSLYERDLRRWAQARGFSVRASHLTSSFHKWASSICIHNAHLTRLRKSTSLTYWACHGCHPHYGMPTLSSK